MSANRAANPNPDAALEEGNQGLPLLGGRASSEGTTTSVRISAFYSWLSHFGTCVLFGLLAAIALKLFGPPIATALIVVFVAILALAYFGWVNLNFRRVATGAVTMLDVDGDGQVGLQDAKMCGSWMYGFVFGFGLTAIGGFLLGFWIGFSIL